MTAANAHDPAIRLMMDAPGPGYRDMAATVQPEMDRAIPSQAILTFQPKDITTATLMPADNDLSEIQITFRPEAFQQIKEYIEFNKAKPIRVEVGDYTLPLDIKKTITWTSGLWLEARPTEKAKTILETLKKQK
ncbi:MAG: hypothetical protein ACOYM3_14970 [Terrimicrobiaceae bacterium]